MSEHGTRRRYQQGCSCLPCRVANAQAVAEWRAHPVSDPWMDASETRTRLLLLEQQGCGLRQIARQSGLSRSQLQAIRNGARTRIRQSDALVIQGLAVAPAAGTLTIAWQTKRWIRALLAEGYAKAQLARLLGLRVGRLHAHTARVRRSTEQRAGQLYKRLTAEGPDANI